MKVIVINVADLLRTPPALSLIYALDVLGHEVVVCAVGSEKNNFQHNLGHVSNVSFRYINEDYSDNSNLIKKYKRMLDIRIRLWEVIDEVYDENTVIWVISEVSLKHLGSRITTKRYVLHFLELLEDLYYISGNPILKMNRKKYTDSAAAIVECEYNRAHITKAWWGLEKLPYILPNKPHIAIDIPCRAEITSSDNLAALIKKLEGKKIVLYQGNISKERPLDSYIRAVDELGDDWAFVMMLNGNNPYPELQTKNAYFIPFVAPPFHLEVTSHAYIGILSYVPIKNSYSILNTLYCAPNKIWEYSKFGVPMIGNDLPALRSMFLEFKNGCCVKNLEKDEIKEAILKIDSSYEKYSSASKVFYDSIDINDTISQIIADSMKK